MAAELACVSPEDVPQIWPYVSHYICRAMERGRMGNFEDVEKDVLGNNSYLWLAIDDGSVLAAAVTKVTQDKDERLCTIVACGGYDWQRFGCLIDGLEKYARTESCSAIEICGRPGWSRRLKDYRTVKIVIRKEVA